MRRYSLGSVFSLIFFISFSVAIVISIVSLLIGFEIKEETFTDNLCSVSTGSSLDGHCFNTFIVGYGSIGTDYYYSAYRQNDDGGLSVVRYDEEMTTLYPTLDDGENAYAELDYSVRYSDGEIICKTLLSVRLFVPKSAVVQEFSLELQ